MYITINELKNIKDIETFFDIKPEGNWEGKNNSR